MTSVDLVFDRLLTVVGGQDLEIQTVLFIVYIRISIPCALVTTNVLMY